MAIASMIDKKREEAARARRLARAIAGDMRERLLAYAAVLDSEINSLEGHDTKPAVAALSQPQMQVQAQGQQQQ